MFAQDFVVGYQDMNFAALSAYLDADPGNADVLTTVVTGDQGHPTIFAPMDVLFVNNVLPFLELFATEPD